MSSKKCLYSICMLVFLAGILSMASGCTSCNENSADPLIDGDVDSDMVEAETDLSGEAENDGVEEIDGDTEKDSVETIDGDASDTPEIETEEEGQTCTFPDPECTENDECVNDEKCIDKKCVAPTSATEYKFNDAISYINMMQIPSAVGAEDPGFDLNGDGKPDDTIGMLLQLLHLMDPDLDIDINRMLKEQISNDSINYLLEFKDIPTNTCEATSLSLLKGEGDLNFDGVTDQSSLDRMSGNGVYQVNQTNFSTGYGPEIQFNYAYFEDNKLSIRAESFPFTLPFKGGDSFNIDIKNFHLETEVVNENGVLKSVNRKSVNHEWASRRMGSINDEDEFWGELGGVRVGGYVPLDSVMQQLNSHASKCECLKIDLSKPMIEYGINDDGVFTASCPQKDQINEDLCGSAEWGFVCSTAESVCSTVDFMGMLADQSTGDYPPVNGKPVLDALSIAVWLSFTGAKLKEEQPLAPEMFATDDFYRIEYNSSVSRLNVLYNDSSTDDESFRISAVSKPSNGGTVDISSDKQSVLYQPPENYKGLETFTYTIGIEPNTKTATVTTTIGYEEPDANEDQYKVTLNRGSVLLKPLENDEIDLAFLELFVPDYSLELTSITKRGTLGEISMSEDHQSVIYTPPAWKKGMESDYFEYNFTDGYLMYNGEPSQSYYPGAVNITFEFPPSVCGDEYFDPWAEVCDEGELNGTPNHCNFECNGTTPSTCGNGTKESGEACDTKTDSKTCDADCTEVVCGDYHHNAKANEGCDDGNNELEACSYGQKQCQVCNPDCKLVAGATSYCGDGTTDATANETCDDNNAVTETCAYGETDCKVCDKECHLVAGATSICGDGNTDATAKETCDDNNAVTETCTYGEKQCKVCDNQCHLVDGATSFCGDGTTDAIANETCDDNNAVTETCTYGEKQCEVCDKECHLVAGATSICGDGNTDATANETCDDNNAVTETCTYGETQCQVCDDQCHLTPGATSFCGDGTTDATANETCDDNNAVTETCTYGEKQCEVCDKECHLVAGATSICGDGNTDATANETCDDNNAVTETCAYGETQCEVCDSECHLAPGATSFCGDGTTDATANETCDDNNAVTETCTYGETQCEVCDSECHLTPGATSFCGDGTTDATANETCDDNNAVTETCTYGETQCEVCDSECHLAPGATSFCGDGTTDATANETCDDGNTTGGDGCDDLCQKEVAYDCTGNIGNWVGCGTTIEAANMQPEIDRWDSYSCDRSLDMSGPEQIFIAEIYQEGSITIDLQDLPSGAHIWLLDICAPSVCLTHGTSINDYPVSNGDKFIIVVDTPNDSLDDFTFTLDCKEEGACAEISEVGCCDGTNQVNCYEGMVQSYDCGSSMGCGWESGNSVYACGGSGSDPSSTYPIDCPADLYTCKNIDPGATPIATLFNSIEKNGALENTDSMFVRNSDCYTAGSESVYYDSFLIYNSDSKSQVVDISLTCTGGNGTVALYGKLYSGFPLENCKQYGAPDALKPDACSVITQYYIDPCQQLEVVIMGDSPTDLFQYEASVYTYDPYAVEICDDEKDNDGDKLVDCDDDDCVQDTACQVLYCAGYSGPDTCCTEDNPCDLASNQVCDCDNTCSWDTTECGSGGDFCEGYTGQDSCCTEQDPCTYSNNQTCDCEGVCTWDFTDCQEQ